MPGRGCSHNCIIQPAAAFGEFLLRSIPVKLRYVLAIVAYCGLIFWLSSQSDPPRPDIDFEGSDKVAHFIVYAVMAVLVSAGLHDAPRQHPAWLRVFGPVLFATAYGMADEVHQLFTPGRHFSFLDMVANTLGAVAGQAGCLYLFRRRAAAKEAKAEGTS